MIADPAKDSRKCVEIYLASCILRTACKSLVYSCTKGSHVETRELCKELAKHCKEIEQNLKEISDVLLCAELMENLFSLLFVTRVDLEEDVLGLIRAAESHVGIVVSFKDVTKYDDSMESILSAPSDSLDAQSFQCTSFNAREATNGPR